MATASPSSPRGGRWTVASAISAVISAFLASLCCLGPLAFAALGLGGAGLLVKFEPYRPYFIAITLALLGLGFYITYRKPAVAKLAGAQAAPDDCGCEHPKSNRVGKVMLWIATVLVVGFLLFPNFAESLFG